MKTFKNVFLVGFPIFLILILFNVATNTNVSLRSIGNYFISQWDLTTKDVTESLVNLRASFDDEFVLDTYATDDTTLSFIERIFNYLKIFVNYIIKGATILFQFVIVGIRIIIVPIRAIFAFINTIIYIATGSAF